MFKTILPNCMAPLIVQATLSFSNAILDAAALGFLGMGAQPPTPEWGTMLAEAREFILRAWWVVTLPGLAILITVLAINLMGDGLRDALDPKLEEELSHGPSRNRKPGRRVRRRRPACSARSTACRYQGGCAREVLAIVGESGSGKSVSMLAVDGAARRGRAKVTADRMMLQRRTCCSFRPGSGAGSSARTWR